MDNPLLLLDRVGGDGFLVMVAGCRLVGLWSFGFLLQECGSWATGGSKHEVNTFTTSLEAPRRREAQAPRSVILQSFCLYFMPSLVGPAFSLLPFL